MIANSERMMEEVEEELTRSVFRSFCWPVDVYLENKKKKKGFRDGNMHDGNPSQYFIEIQY